ncbi:MAG: ABC transporter permease [Ruminococcus sp.]|nr:ABC transporter permease [Ruminococcus sp.]
MNKLIKANFSRLFKSMFFKVCLIFSAGLGILMDMARYIDIQKNQELYAKFGVEYKSADGFAFSLVLYIIFAISAFTAVFVGTDYSDCTIRNKLMVGNKRTEIYFANFITCAVANVIILMTSIIVTLGFGYALFRVTSLTAKETAICIIIQCVTMIGFSAILVLISMLIQSKASGAVTALIMTIVMFLAAMTISNKLEAPEYYEDLTEITSETGEVQYVPVETKNPSYITGTKREIYELLNDILPCNQFYQIACCNTENAGKLAIYSALIMILSNGAGVVLFRKKDLK